MIFMVSAGCERSPTRFRSASSSASSSIPSPTPSSELPAGVLAQAKGIRGIVRVEQRDTTRVLTIDGVVQGGQQPGLLPEQDPLVLLAKTIRPQARTVLLIGLGTGATATALSRAGLDVVAVELDPVVIDFARRYFSYQGHAIAADGLAFAKSDSRVFDVVVIDAFDGTQGFSDLTTSQAMQVFLERRARDGLVMVRTVDKPDSAAVNALWQAWNDRFRIAMTSGINNEPQVIVVLGSQVPMIIEDGGPIPLWPMHGTEQVSPAMRETLAASEQSERQVVLMGYLVRDPSGVFVVDLPHVEMGAIRYVLDEPAAKAVSPLLADKTTFPTQGDIRTDGDLSGTLHEVLGGGGVKRSEVRFSPVVVKVQGKARLRALVDPDWGMSSRQPRRLPTNPLLPYGGVLYELQDAHLLWSLRYSDWNAVHTRRLRPLARRAAVRLTRGEIQEGLKELRSYLQEVETSLGAAALPLPLIEDIRVLRSRLEALGDPPSTPPTASWTARACDRAVHSLPEEEEETVTDGALLRSSLRSCALTYYERAALRANPDDALFSARRLLALIDDEDSATGRRLLKAIRARYGELSPLQELPEDSLSR